MKIQFKKRKSKASILNCIREDGSVTWSQIHPNFEVHDLAHYAVETVLGFKKAFYGLLSDGFNIEDFELQRDKRPEALVPANLPPESLQTEHLVNLLLTDLQSGGEHLNLIPTLKEILTREGLPYPNGLNTDSLAEIQQSLNDLLAQWEALGEDETLELFFVR
ncbi:hypothetical protein [Flagellimonas algicola]|uniref:Uncharacterized protein n=1 Tax=Flagellimonas algicola TaxID=2583815 RepID=A0ABY2WKC8_9FLAO|nr:hypothetical protein [Allomuricauda algicola]TMU55288.1 hypothetical protein FGG15_14000 [Allomuricauda algicola]